MARLSALVLAVLVGVVAIAAIWANDQLLDTGSWSAISGRLLENQEVRHRVAAFLGEELVAETEAQLLAAGQGEVAEKVMPMLRGEQTRLAERVMATPRFRAIWQEANRAGHRVLVRAVAEEGAAAHGPVDVDLTPALRQIADELESGGLAGELGVSDLAALVEPGAARIEVLEAEELEQAQDVARVVRHLTLPALVALLVLYALALFFGRRRLSGTFLWIGVALVATGALALLARALAGHAIVDELLGREADREAGEAAWGIATSTVTHLAVAAIALGAIVFAVTLAWRWAARPRWVAG